MTRRRRLAAVAAIVGLALAPVAIGSAQAAAPPPLPHTDPAAPPTAGQAPRAASDAAQPASAPAAVPDLPIQASDIALSFPNQPGTGVVLTDAARQRRAIAAAGGAAAWAKQQAAADAMLKRYNAEKGQLRPVIDSAPSGHRPYGGDMWSGGTVTANKSSCTVSLPSRSSSGAQYEYTAGHCVREDGVHDDINATTGVFCVGFVNPCPSIDIGNTGHGGTCVGSATTCGDRTFLRGSKIPVGNDGRAEVRTWDSRVTVAVPAVGNPVYGEAASLSGGMSGRLIHSTVLVTGQTVQFAAPAPVIYVAVMETTEGCSVPGDSGGSIIAGDHTVIGTLSGHAPDPDGIHCWLYFGRAGDAFTQAGQVPAPQP